MFVAFYSSSLSLVRKPYFMAGVTSCPNSSLKRNEEFAASFELPYCKKTADELLLGLLDDAEQISFSGAEVFRDEAFQGMSLEKCVHGCSYLELIGINGKASHLLYQFQRLTMCKRNNRY